MSDAYEQLYSVMLDTIHEASDLILESDRDREILASRIYDNVTYLFMVEPVENVYNARAARLQAA